MHVKAEFAGVTHQSHIQQLKYNERVGYLESCISSISSIVTWAAENRMHSKYRKCSELLYRSHPFQQNTFLSVTEGTPEPAEFPNVKNRRLSATRSADPCPAMYNVRPMPRRSFSSTGAARSTLQKSPSDLHP